MPDESKGGMRENGKKALPRKGVGRGLRSVNGAGGGPVRGA